MDSRSSKARNLVASHSRVWTAPLLTCRSWRYARCLDAAGVACCLLDRDIAVRFRVNAIAGGRTHKLVVRARKPPPATHVHGFPSRSCPVRPRPFPPALAVTTPGPETGYTLADDFSSVKFCCGLAALRSPGDGCGKSCGAAGLP